MNKEEIKISIAQLFEDAGDDRIVGVESGDDPNGSFVVIETADGKVFEITIKQTK